MVLPALPLRCSTPLPVRETTPLPVRETLRGITPLPVREMLRDRWKSMLEVGSSDDGCAAARNEALITPYAKPVYSRRATTY